MNVVSVNTFQDLPRFNTGNRRPWLCTTVKLWISQLSLEIYKYLRKEQAAAQHWSTCFARTRPHIQPSSSTLKGTSKPWDCGKLHPVNAGMDRSFVWFNRQTCMLKECCLKRAYRSWNGFGTEATFLSAIRTVILLPSQRSEFLDRLELPWFILQIKKSKQQGQIFAKMSKVLHFTSFLEESVVLHQSQVRARFPYPILCRGTLLPHLFLPAAWFKPQISPGFW